MSIEQLKQVVEEAFVNEENARIARQQAEQTLTNAIAESIGIAVGSVVRVKGIRGYGSSAKNITQRYRVTHMSLGHRNGLSLRGRTIRKDGTDGDIHDIWQQWDLEKAEVSA